MAGTKVIRLSGKYAAERNAYAIVDEEDYDMLVQMGSWYLSDTGYAVRRCFVDGRSKTVRMHRVVNDTPDGLVTDHLNRNRLDNRKSNLRSTDQAANAKNRRSIGYSWDTAKNKWVVRYMGRHYGRYSSEEEARRAYRLACSGVEYAKKDRRPKFHLPTGVFRNRSNKKYQAKAVINGKRFYLGSFATVEEAESAYLERKRG